MDVMNASSHASQSKVPVVREFDIVGRETLFPVSLVIVHIRIDLAG